MHIQHLLSSKRDLYKYPLSDLLTLAKHYGIAAKNRVDLCWILSLSILEPVAIRGTMPGLDSINYADITSKECPDSIRAFFKYVKESGNRNCEEMTKTIACSVGAGSFGVVVETSPTDESVYKISGIKEIDEPRAYANKFSEFFAGVK
jgi:hypothetical protein